MAVQIKTTDVRSPNPVDVHVGSRIRLRRTLLGKSQSVLADNLGLTFQQVQKYERGANRVGASRLYDLSKALSVPVSFFFDGIETEDGVPKGLTVETNNDRKTLELVRNYSVLTDPEQKSVSNLVKGLADAHGTETRGEVA